MREKYFLVLLFAASLALKLPFALTTTSFGVDESLYLATARNLVETGDFGMRTEFYDFKFISPLFPMLESAFYFIGGELGALFVSPIFSSLAILVFYFLGKSVFNEKIGRLAALIGLSAPPMILLGTRPLTESMAIFFFSLAVLSLYLFLKDKKYGIFGLIFPIAFILTFLSRFQYGGLLLIFFIAYVLLSRNYSKLANYRFVGGIALAALLISPWIIFNLENYGSALGAPGHQASTDTGFNPSVAYLYFPYAGLIMGLMTPFVLFGLYKSIKLRNIFLAAAFIVVFLAQFFVFGKVAEERYLLPLIPAVSVLGAWGFLSMYNQKRKFLALIFLAFIGLNTVAGYYGVMIYQNFDRYVETKEAVMFLKENCPSPVMSNSFTHVWYYANYDNIPLLPTTSETLNMAVNNSVMCVMVSMYEAPFIDPLKDSVEAEKIFGNNKVTVYKLA